MALPYPASGPTAITTQNLTPTAAPTAGSAVQLFPGNAACVSVEVTGTYTGALSAQVTVDGSTWTTLTGSVFVPINGSAATAAIASGSTGKWTVALSGWTGVQITALAAFSGTANVSLNPGDGAAASASGGGVATSVNVAQVGGTAVVTGGVAGTQGVGGAAAAGTAIASAGNPILLAGSDGTTSRTLVTGAGVTGTGVLRAVLATDVVPGTAYTSRTDVTRPANTTAYTAGDVVGGAITFASAGPSGGRVLITTADLGLYISSIPTGMTTFTLYLYDVTPPSAIADNSPFDMPSGDRASYLGQISLGAPIDLGSTCYTTPAVPSLEVKLANGSTSLFGYLVTSAGYTPAANSEVYSVRFSSIGAGN